ncbi:MAG: DMT family transporter [Methylococcaceae bacterium]|jgi:drug/metabolite transporter (DMT)-like permease
MRVALAYISVILLWVTTPLAIKWSTEGVGYIFAVTARMTLGLLCVLLILIISRQGLPWHKKARHTYYAVSVQIFGAMFLVYWSAPYLPSGWISVVFGLTPLLTGLLAAIWLKQRSLTASKVLSYFLGIAGLSLMFGSALQIGLLPILGIIGVLLAALLQSTGAVWLERISSGLPAITQVAGGLLLSAPLYWLTWFILDGQWPSTFPQVSVAAIAYLGVIATAFGFVMYYYIIKQIGAVRVAVLPLTSPVLALLLGHVANNEPLNLKISIGTALILTALLMHVFLGTAKKQAVPVS